jgi:phosphatidylglycerophosphate synthase
MDSAADKTLVAAAMLALTSSGRLSVWLVFLFVVREFAVFGLRAIRPRGGATVAEIADKIGRLRFFILHVGIIALLLSEGSRWLRVSGFYVITFSTCLAYAGLVYYIVRDWPTLHSAMRKFVE